MKLFLSLREYASFNVECRFVDRDDHLKLRIFSQNVLPFGFRFSLKSPKLNLPEYKFFLSIVEPRFNEVPRDWANWFVISRIRYIENLVITNLLENNQSVRYIGV